MAALPRSSAASGDPSLSSRLSTSVSTRLTKNDATDARLVRSWPAARARSMPSMKASITAR
jgi:hypothetical protein